MPPYRLIHPRGQSRKLAGLDPMQFRVWVQYLLSADDFGVMLRSTLKLQADCKFLATRKAVELDRCLTVLEKCGLVHRFEHQGDDYLYQQTWQDYQKITWPAKTTNPPVPAVHLAACSEATRLLFTVHPGAKKAPLVKLQSTAEVSPSVLQSTAEATPKNFEKTSATRETLILTKDANANLVPSSEGSLRETEPRYDLWWAEVVETYPGHRVRDSRLVSESFMEQLRVHPGGPQLGWALFKANLALNISSHEWMVSGRAPGLDKYILEKRWKHALPAGPPAAEQMSKSTSVTVAAMAEILKGRAS